MNDRQVNPNSNKASTSAHEALSNDGVRVPGFAQYASEMLTKELTGILQNSVSTHYQELLNRAGVNVLDDVAEHFITVLLDFEPALSEAQVDQVLQLTDALDDQQSTELANRFRNALMKQVPQGSPLQGRLLMEHGDALFEQGEEQAAIQSYREGILLLNTADEAYQVLILSRLETIAYLQLEENELQAADNTYSDIIARCNRFPESTNIEILSALQELATTFTGLEDYSRAEDVLLNLLRRTGTAVELVEYRAQAMNTLGDVYAETNKISAARDCYRLSLAEFEMTLPENDFQQIRVENLRSKYIDVLKRLGDVEEYEKQILKQG